MKSNVIDIEAFHNRTGQWVTLLEAEKCGWQEKDFVSEFAKGGNSHAALGSSTINRTHFSAFRIVGEHVEIGDEPLPF